jgi:hypothetical protein
MSGEEEEGASDEDEITFGTPGVLQNEVSSAAIWFSCDLSKVGSAARVQ